MSSDIKQEIEEVLSKFNIVDIISAEIDLHKKGKDYFGLCPFHKESTPSFSVSPPKQIFKCHGCGKGGDMIDYIRERHGLKTREAIRYLNGDITGLSVKPLVIQSTPKPPMIIWKDATPTYFPTEITHYEKGKPSKVWAYRNADGVVVGYTCRFELPGGKKDVLPFTFKTNGEKSEWRWAGMDTPRVIYNLHLLKQNPKASVLLVEGEKSADAANVHLDNSKCVAITWIGGANGIRNTDFSVLSKRTVIFWADNDRFKKYNEGHEKAGEIKPWFEQPGNEAMLEIGESIKDIVNSGRRWVQVPDDLENYPDKWDCADKEWGEGEFKNFITQNMIDFPKLQTDLKDPFAEEKIADSELVIDFQKPEEKKPIEKTVAVAEPLQRIANPPLPPAPPVETSNNKYYENEHFKMLGYEEDENMKIVFYFFSFKAKTVVRLSPTSMNKSNLQLIAPLFFWEDNFSGNKTKVDIDAAQAFLINNSYVVGLYRDKFIRGRGAWMENDKLIIHAGEYLLIEGTKHPLKNFNSRYVYKIGEPLGFGQGVALDTQKSAKLIDHIKWLLWEREIDAYLLAGWCVIAPFCGVLNWRPHIWITGAAGSGKSYTMEQIVKRLLGDVGLSVQGKTTEAGVRGLLKSDARPVLFDESDVDSVGDKERIQSILALARSSSYSEGGDIVKGTQSGGSKTYTIRSCFAFSSIGVQLNQQSDRSRFTTLALQSFEGFREKEDFIKFEQRWNDLMAEDFVDSLQTRTAGLINTILKNAKVFSDATASLIGNKRVGDQVGSMLAGAYSLISRKEISYEAAYEWIKAKDWSEEKALEATKDERQLFELIISATLDVEASHGILRRTVGELVLLAANRTTEALITAESAHNRLRRIGIMISDDNINISNTATGIKDLIKNTSWGASHPKILERIDGAKKVEPRTYAPGISSRGVSIPLKLVSANMVINSQIEAEPAKLSENDDLPF